jgi:hypothetical protein
MDFLDVSAEERNEGAAAWTAEPESPGEVSVCADEPCVYHFCGAEEPKKSRSLIITQSGERKAEGVYQSRANIIQGDSAFSSSISAQLCLPSPSCLPLLATRYTL